MLTPVHNAAYLLDACFQDQSLFDDEFDSACSFMVAAANFKAYKNKNLVEVVNYKAENQSIHSLIKTACSFIRIKRGVLLEV